MGGVGWTDGRQNFCSENIKMERTSVTKTRVEKNEGGWRSGRGEREKESMNGKSTSASRRKKKKKQRRKEGFACVCVRLQVGERERVEMDRRLSYIFFSFSLAPF